MDSPLRDRWSEIRALFEAALDVPRAEREAHIEAATDDLELRAAVRQLLNGELGATLGATRGKDANTAIPAPAGGVCTGSAVGPFRLAYVLGSGGMGEVWLGLREGVDFVQKVAVKLLHPGLERADAARRFVQERQMLASLSHPDIARLVDGGVAPDGQLWYAMEYVDGRPITEHAASRDLGIRERVELLACVARAVAAAQAQGIVHRDLKPSNILVDQSGRPRLLDFGIAKWLADSAGPVETATGLRALTPAYAAPEQILGEPVTRATDVYALGVVAFELLAGELPFDRRGTSLEGMAERVRSEEVTAPSRRAPARQRVAKTRIDRALDLVVMQCLRRYPAERYPDAAALAADLDRWLAGEPVRARGRSLGWRLRRGLSRWRMPIVVTALLIALASSWLWRAPGPPPVGAVIASAAELEPELRASYEEALAEIRAGDARSLQQARARLQDLITKQPDFTRAPLDLAGVVFRLSRLRAVERSEVMQILRPVAGNVLARHPADFNARAMTARLEYIEAEILPTQPKMLSVLRQHETLLSERPRDVELLQIAMQAAGTIGQLEKAIQFAEQANKIAEDPRNYAGMVRALGDLGRVDEALAAQARGLELSPRRSDLYAYLIQTLARTGRFDEALDQVERCERNRADDCETRRQWILSLLRATPPRQAPLDGFGAAVKSGGFLAARAWVDDEVSRGHDVFVDYHSQLLTIALAESRWQEALDIVQRSAPGLTDGDPPIPHITELVVIAGIAYRQLGDEARAERAFNQVLDVLKDIPESTRQKYPQLPDVLALSWLGRNAEAVALLERYAELGWSGERDLTDFPCWSDCIGSDLGLNPLAAVLHPLPEFQAVTKTVRERNERILADLRARGRVAPAARP